jgi:hypothetical protein
MLHEFIFKFCAYIQTRMLIITKIILKYRSFVLKNQESDFHWWYLYVVATSTCVLNLKYRVSNKLMISPKHSTWFLLIKTSLSLFMKYFIARYTSWECFMGFVISSFLLTFQIYCLETPIIGLQHLYQRYPQFPWLSLWNVSWLSNDVLPTF